MKKNKILFSTVTGETKEKVSKTLLVLLITSIVGLLVTLVCLTSSITIFNIEGFTTAAIVMYSLTMVLGLAISGYSIGYFVVLLRKYDFEDNENQVSKILFTCLRITSLPIVVCVIVTAIIGFSLIPESQSPDGMFNLYTLWILIASGLIPILANLSTLICCALLRNNIK